ncbi:MAG: hypothetical protein AAF907_10135, partial [Planctomycetota bacterium]
MVVRNARSSWSAPLLLTGAAACFAADAPTPVTPSFLPPSAAEAEAGFARLPSLADAGRWQEWA